MGFSSFPGGFSGFNERSIALQRASETFQKFQERSRSVPSSSGASQRRSRGSQVSSRVSQEVSRGVAGVFNEFQERSMRIQILQRRSRCFRSVSGVFRRASEVPGAFQRCFRVS